MKAARKAFAFSWIYYTVFVVAVMGLAFGLRVKPYILGLPCWVAVSVIFVPAGFVALSIILVEHIIPDLPLTDDETKGETE